MFEDETKAAKKERERIVAMLRHWSDTCGSGAYSGAFREAADRIVKLEWWEKLRLEYAANHPEVLRGVDPDGSR